MTQRLVVELCRFVNYKHQLTVFAAIIAMGLPAGAQEVYKSVDQKGVVEFSDQPSPGAKAVEVKPNVVPVEPVKSSSPVSAGSAEKPDAVATGSDRESTQAQLDAECEAARERKLAPERAKYIEECVRDKVKDSREACERFYSDYGAQSGDRPPLYYDLPECRRAFEFRKSSR